MTLKEVKARYKRVILGFLWIILNPLLQMLMIGLIFQFFVPIKIDNYFYFLFAGLLPWNFFSYSIIKCTPIYLNERALIQKAKFPREALVLSIVFSNLFHFLVALLLFGIFAILIGLLVFWKLAILLIAVLWILVLCVGVSLLLSTLFVKYRDIKFIVDAIVPLWFYATPIVYSRSLLPSLMNQVLRLNPMTAIIELFQFVFNRNQLPLDFLGIIMGVTVSVIICCAGLLLFVKENKYFDDWL